MTRPPKPPIPPHLAFDPARRAACLLLEGRLREAWQAPALRITLFDQAASRAFSEWDMARRGRTWAWPSLVGEGRKDEPSAFEAALWHGDVLCGLAHGKGGPGFCAIEFVEGNPDPGHPLKGMVLRAAVRAAVAYTGILGRPELRVARPRDYVARRLRQEDPSIPLVPSGAYPYHLRMLVRSR